MFDIPYVQYLLKRFIWKKNRSTSLFENIEEEM